MQSACTWLTRKRCIACTWPGYGFTSHNTVHECPCNNIGISCGWGVVLLLNEGGKGDQGGRAVCWVCGVVGGRDKRAAVSRSGAGGEGEEAICGFVRVQGGRGGGEGSYGALSGAEGVKVTGVKRLCLGWGGWGRGCVWGEPQP